MKQDGAEGVRHAPGSGTSHGTKQAPSAANIPPLALVRKVFNTSISLPEIHQMSNDRQGRREFREATRELGQVALYAAKAGAVVDAVRAVGTYVFWSFDRGQEDLMEIYYGKSRYPELSEMVGQVLGQCAQQMAAGMLTAGELHIKRQTGGL
jgi:hypothetical protein